MGWLRSANRALLCRRDGPPDVNQGVWVKTCFTMGAPWASRLKQCFCQAKPAECVPTRRHNFVYWCTITYPAHHSFTQRSVFPRLSVVIFIRFVALGIVFFSVTTTTPCFPGRSGTSLYTVRRRRFVGIFTFLITRFSSVLF
eukprot:Lithocolla_globosa_v1_NODE_405_length_4144_cov_33.349474.p3 type:complete len:142 gc:universal NODE_405_length_4144_cov_33.349474:967-542(-)